MTKKLEQRIQEKCIIKNYAKNPPFPKNMLLEVTNICNHKCIFCANSKSTAKKGLMDFQVGRKIIKEAYECGIREVGFYATGEPLIHPELEKFIKYAKEIGYEYVYITTNGALMNEARSRSIIEAGIDSVKFSINASNSRDYLLIHGKDDFVKVVENIRTFNQLRNMSSKKINLFVSCIFTKQTNSEKDKLKELLEQDVDEFFFLNCLNQGGYMHEIDSLLTNREPSRILTEEGMCPLIFSNLYVSWQGLLTMCCTDFQNYLAVDDLTITPLKEAWNNRYAQWLREAHLKNKLEGTLCYNCLRNKKKEISPLVEKYATIFNYEEVDQSKQIVKRIDEWEKNY